MAKHKVFADVGTFDVGIVDVIFKVHQDGSLLGKLKVSQGGVEWQVAHGKKHQHSLSWRKLEDIFLDRGRRVRKPGVHGPLRKRRV